MQTASHLYSSQKGCVALAESAFEPKISPSQLLDSSIMRCDANTTGSRPPLSSSNTTPTSTRRSSLSSLNHSNGSSASSDASAGILKRSSMKSNLKHSRSVGANLNRRSAPPTVRFLDPEPLPDRSMEPGKTMSLRSPTSEPRPVRPGNSRVVSSPNFGSHQYRQKKIMVSTLTRPPLLSPASKRANAAGLLGGTAAGSSHTLSLAQPHSEPSSGPVTQLSQFVDKRSSAPAALSQIDPRIDPRWSGIPLPAGFIPPSRTPTPTRRNTSYQTVISNLSPPLTTPATLSSYLPLNTYDPLQNYIPCMAVMCTAHYTPAHSGPTYYVAQEPFHLSRHHGYCPRHASKEMQEANALCKKEYETMRQNAGRKTLGAIAQDFEIFLQLYREARKSEDARLQKAQSERVIGSSQVIPLKGRTLLSSVTFDWRYTPRNCTTRGCKSPPYSPFSTQNYSFYGTPHSSTQLLPLTILCPPCAKIEAEGFGAKLMVKWSSRCGWDGEEWDGWYQNALQDRKMELEFWEKAQERVVRERLVKKATKGAIENAELELRSTEENDTRESIPKKEKRKSVFKRIFGRSSTTSIPAVASVTA